MPVVEVQVEIPHQEQEGQNCHLGGANREELKVLRIPSIGSVPLFVNINQPLDVHRKRTTGFSKLTLFLLNVLL